MKMKRFVTAAVALLLMVSLVGTGFSYWFFNNYTTSSDSVDLTKSVTQLIEVGSITAADSFELKFDQATKPSPSSLTQYTHEGIKAVFATGANQKATYASPTDSDSNTVDKVDGQVTYDFIVTMTISEGLAQYFTASMKNNVTDWTVEKAENAVDGKITITFTGNEKTEFDWNNVEFSYETNQEPTTKDALNTLRSTVSSGSISVVYTVTLRDVTNS